RRVDRVIGVHEAELVDGGCRLTRGLRVRLLGGLAFGLAFWLLALVPLLRLVGLLLVVGRDLLHVLLGVLLEVLDAVLAAERDGLTLVRRRDVGIDVVPLHRTLGVDGLFGVLFLGVFLLGRLVGLVRGCRPQPCNAQYQCRTGKHAENAQFHQQAPIFCS